MRPIKNIPVSPTPCNIITYTMKIEQNLCTLELCFDKSEGFNIQSNLFILAFSVGICDMESTLVANDFTPSPTNDIHAVDFETMQERRWESMVASKMSFFPRVNTNNGIPLSRPFFLIWIDIHSTPSHIRNGAIISLVPEWNDLLE